MTETKASLETAIKLATEAHEGQQDKAGKSYIEHPLRVMAAMQTDQERAAAVLHDVIEDSPLTAADLIDAGMPAEVVDAVVAVTKVKPCVYQDYLDQVKRNDIARTVKLADLRDNLNLDRLPMVTDEDWQRHWKYKRAVDFLLSEEV